MSLAVVTAWRINPGRTADFMEALATSAGIVRRHGGSVRVFQATAAGENTGTVNFVIESEDRHAWADVYDGLMGDPEWQALFSDMNAADAPGVILSQSLANEITPD